MSGLKYAKQTFITMPNRNTLATVTAKAQAIYIWLCCMQDNTGTCWPSIDTLAKLTHTSRETVKRACKELEAAGLIARQFSGPHAMKSTNRYEILIKDTEPVSDSSYVADGQHIMSHQGVPMEHNEPTMAHNEPSDGSNTMAHNEPLTKKKGTKTNRTKIDSTNVLSRPTAKKTPRADIDGMFKYWESTTGIAISSRIKQNRYACSNLLKKYDPAKLRQLIQGVAVAQQTAYAPRISDFTQLQAKLTEIGRAHV